jgi:hypothetical protein
MAELVSTEGREATVPVNKDLRKALQAYWAEGDTNDHDHVFTAATRSRGRR